MQSQDCEQLKAKLASCVMAPIPLKRVVSVTSEDPLNPASNLLSINSTAGKKWLSAHDNKSRRSEVVLELAKRSRITSLEIVNFGSAFVEVLVSNNGSPDDYTTLLPSSMLMSIANSRGGRGKTTTLKCGREKLSKTAVDLKWSLVKIQISQKFNLTEQFGLQHVALHNDTPTSYKPFRQSDPTSTPTHTPLSPPTQSAHSVSTPRHRIPPLPGHLTPTEHAQKIKNGTPKRTSRTLSDEEEDYEFAGIERQSRLFKNCVRRKPSDGDTKPEPNSILNRISSDKKKYSEKLTFDPSYQRRRLLKKELPKAESTVDFAETFKEEDTKKSLGLSGLSAFDDETEIGEEREDKWSWGKRGKRKKKHPQSVAPRGWLSKRKKIDQLIVECESLVKGKQTSCSSHMKNKLPKMESIVEDDLSHIEEVDLNESQSASDDGDGVEVVEGVSMVECPVCGVMLPGYAIEVHASTCGDSGSDLRPTVGIICID